jgi:hypothetical protein
MSNTVIHIGFPKTATTTLQNHLFAKHPGIHYLGKPYRDDDLKGMIRDLVMQESTVYNADNLEQYINKHLAQERETGKKVFLISDETFVSAAKVRDKGVVAHRLKDLFAAEKILVTIRNQMDAVKSGYIGGGRLLRNVPGKYKNMIVSFKDWLEISKNMYHGDFVRNVVYFNTIDYYTRLFGKENICILLFEDFVKNTDEFIGKLSLFLDIDFETSRGLIQSAHENKRISRVDFQIETLRSKLGFMRNVTPIVKFMNGVRKIWGALGTDRRSDVEIPEEWYQQLWDLYKEGNRKLMEKFQLPLDQYGYPL